jgi:hypothetical protein
MTTIILALTLLTQMSQEKVYSGPQKGEKTPGFKVVDMNSDRKGQEVDYVAEWKGAPTLIVFVHELTRPVAQLLRKLDEHRTRRADLRSIIVLLGEDPDKNERYAPVLQGIMKYKSVLAVSSEGKEGPGSYGLNRDVQVTVVVAKDNVVTGNWAITSPNETDAPAICKTIDDTMGFQEPKPDLEARVAALEKEIRELKEMVDRLLKQQPPAAKPERRLPGAAPKDATLNGLMRKMINRERTNDEIDATLTEMEEYVQGKPDLEKELVDGFILLRELKYGTEHAQKVIRDYLERLKK